MLFTEQRLHFFRPLTGKYREQVVACLRGLYARLYSSMADYSRVVQRELVLEVFQEAITQTPALDDSDDDKALPARNEREQASWMLNLLLEYGWLERHADEHTLTSTYAFSRIGRVFTQPMHELGGGRFRTRHRNTRNALNALRSFLEKKQADDLLDAYEHSERIVADFTDDIAELEERKRELLRDVEAQQIVQRASDEFFEFMEKRFMPDLALRFSEDSIVKYRDELTDLLYRARRLRREVKAQTERELRRLAPSLASGKQQSLYLYILDQIDGRVHSAADIMLPALRRSLEGFTRRADILLRQLNFSAANRHELLDAMRELAQLSDSEQDVLLSRAGETMASLQVGFADPDALQLHSTTRKRMVNNAVQPVPADDPQARRRLFVEQALERAFAVNNRQIYDYLVAALANGHEIRTGGLPMRDARELLYAAHSIEIGSASWSNYDFRFEVLATGQRIANDYFLAQDEFIVRVVEARR
jgi:hypothetical protein